MVSVSQRETSRRHLAALPCRGMSNALRPKSQRGVRGPNPFDVGRNSTSPGSNTDLLRTPYVDTRPATKDSLKYRGEWRGRDEVAWN